jgi:hypothetical protein
MFCSFENILASCPCWYVYVYIYTQIYVCMYTCVYILFFDTIFGSIVSVLVLFFKYTHVFFRLCFSLFDDRSQLTSLTSL